MQERSTDATAQLQNLRDGILEKIELALPETYQPARQASYCDSEDQGHDGIVGTPEQKFSEPLRLVREVKASLDTLLQNKNGPSPEIRILRRVFFPSLYMRKEGMRPADVDTFEWILKGSVEEIAEEFAEESQEENTWEPKEAARRKAKIARKKSAAATRLLEWLRNGNGVFHISGKAGSGKSTMMKLLLENERTRQELDHWSGQNPLLFAHFFFWSSGDQLQQSWEGLYRSLLFEILIQCPQLTREVFPSAYNAFIRSNAEECIEDLFFTPKAFQDAFRRLISRPSQSDYRICLFIDGLDEYGGGQDDYSGDDIDDLEHQYLAESLNTWASQDSIKILVSSRPHRAFEDIFDNNLRIRLHELTRLDIVCSGLQMFEKDRSFQRPEVKACYKRLVEAVAEQAEGVFLWATFAIRDLLNCIKRYDRIDSLQKRLDSIPRNFNKLYEKMFNSIDIRDRTKALNLMLLIDAPASMENGYTGLTAVSITWLDDLEDPEFPMAREFEPYTDEEIEKRQLEAECQLDSLTKGLVELRQLPQQNTPLFFRQQVKFFHRTVRDFVRQSQNIDKFSIKGSDYTPFETCVRLHLMELFFAASKDVGCSYIWDTLFWGVEYRPGLDAILDGYERAINYHNQKGLDPSPLSGLTMDESLFISRYKDTASFLHFLAYHGCTGYIERRVAAHQDYLPSSENLSLLLSAAIGNSTTTVKALIDAGVSPYDLIKSKSAGSDDMAFTVWHWFCTTLYRLGRRGFVYDQQLCKILLYFLEAGVNRDCYFLFHLRGLEGSDESEIERSSTYVVTLESFVRRWNPPDLQELLALMEKPGTPLEIPSSFNPEDYISFDLEAVSGEMHKVPGEWPSSLGFKLCAVVCGGKWMYSRSMKVRVF
jgi:hypothetical protein